MKQNEIAKAAAIDSDNAAVSEDELRLINGYTRRALTADEE